MKTFVASGAVALAFLASSASADKMPDIDFNDDGLINAVDTGFFRSQYLVSHAAQDEPSLLPWTDDGQAYRDYIAADLDNSAVPNPHGTHLSAPAVTDDDLAIMDGCFAWMPGDANWDGRVDLSDLNVMGAWWGVSDGATRFHADFNGDGAVNSLDLSILSGTYTSSYDVYTGGGEVPEPATACLLAAGALCPLVRRRRSAGV